MQGHGDERQTSMRVRARWYELASTLPRASCAGRRNAQAVGSRAQRTHRCAHGRRSNTQGFTVKTQAQIEKQRAYRAAYYAANKPKFIAAMRRWNAANPEKVRANQRKYWGLPEPTRLEPAHCEICARAFPRHLCLDHDHATGKFRGWLCTACNRGLGFFRDNPDIILHAAVYLERNK